MPTRRFSSLADITFAVFRELKLIFVATPTVAISSAVPKIPLRTLAMSMTIRNAANIERLFSTSL
jgi:glycerol-3-phosphate acyltransferase PlsY